MLNTVVYAIVFVTLSLAPSASVGPQCAWQVVQCDSAVKRCPLMLRWSTWVALALLLQIIGGVESYADILSAVYLDMVGKAAQMWLWCAVTTRRRDPLVSAYFILVALSRVSELEGFVYLELTFGEAVLLGLPMVVTGVLAIVHIGWAVGNKYDLFVNHMVERKQRDIQMRSRCSFLLQRACGGGRTKARTHARAPELCAWV